MRRHYLLGATKSQYYEFIPFTTVARTDGTIKLVISSGLTVANYEYIKYSTDNGETWTKVDNVNSERISISVSVNTGDRVQWKGKGIRMATSTSVITRFVGSTAQFDIEGNIMSLLNEDKYVGTQITANYTFHQLFNGSTTLINAKNLILPTNVLGQSYRATFQNCSNLLTSPELPATTLATGCYQYMFRNCTKLSSIKCLATTLATSSTSNWVSGVAASGTFTKAASMTSWTTGANGIPSGWEVYNY